MSFTSSIKKEIIAYSLPRKQISVEEKRAALSAFLRTSGNVGFYDKKPAFFIVSETENVAEYFMEIFQDAFGCELAVTHATMDKMSGRDKLLLQCPPSCSEQALKGLWALKRTGEFREGIASAIMADERLKIAYIKGAFLGSGSCTLPHEKGKTGYHLEIVFAEKKAAKGFCKLLFEFELLAKMTERKETYVVYLKSKEIISDFLAVIGVKKALAKFLEFVEKRDEANYDNRTKNCQTGNADKLALAAEKQVAAIDKLLNSELWEDLSDELKALAKLRRENPTFSLQQLADNLCVSKSCLNHRMRKLMELANQTNK